MRLIIVDDEMHARQTLSSIIKLKFEELEIIAMADSCKMAIEQINLNKPDLILLDINLPDGTGFDILKKVEYNDFKIIFITAYEEFALQAIKFSAFDYILKPVDPIELVESIQNCIKEAFPAHNRQKIEAFNSNYNNPLQNNRKLVLKTADKIYVVETNEIVRCESDNAYTTFFFENKPKIMVSKNLKSYEKLLSVHGFMRVHQSHLVNLDKVVCYDKQCGGALIMIDGAQVPVSQQKKPMLLEFINNMQG